MSGYSLSPQLSAPDTDTVDAIGPGSGVPGQSTFGNSMMQSLMCQHVVQPGETLSGIASANGQSDWHELYERNQSVVGSNPNLIYPNQVLNTCSPEQEQTANDFGTGFAQEGLGGLFDIQGMLDRQAAQRELRANFDVVADDYTGERKPNTVTESEFRDLSRNYSDIRLGRGDLTMDTSSMSAEDAKKFREGAMNDIATILTTPSGRHQIAALHDNVQKDDNGNVRKFLNGADVTGTAQESQGSAQHRHTTLTDLHQDANGNNDLSDDPTAPLDLSNAVTDPKNNTDRFRTATGRGLGTDTTIRYNPGTRIDDNNDGTPDHQSTSDIILMHEMGHARDQTQGNQYDGKVKEDPWSIWNFWRQDQNRSGNPDIDHVNEREHQAAGLGHYVDPLTGIPDDMTENRYRMERRQLGATQPDGTPVPQRPNYSTLP